MLTRVRKQPKPDPYSGGINPPLNPGQERAHLLMGGPQRHTCLVGGSRSGKTSLFVRQLLVRGIRAPKSRHIALRFRANAARASLTLDTIPTVQSRWFPGLELIEHRQDGYFSLPNGSEVWINGLDEKERVDKVLGNEYSTIFFNECSQIPYASVVVMLTRLAQSCPGLVQRAWYDLNPGRKGHWTNRQFGEKRDPVSLRPLADPDNYQRMFINPGDNKENLSAEYIQSLERLPERQRKRFFEGTYQDEVDGALWTIESIERCRTKLDDFGKPIGLPNMQRIVIAVDPSGASAKSAELDRRSDDIGIVVVGLGFDGRVYLLEDLTLNGPPEVWGRVAISAYHTWRADTMIAEVNFGGDMVAYVIRSMDGSVPVKVVTASRGKAVRAEPVSVLYEPRQDKVRHAGYFPELEDQLTAFSSSGYTGDGSPDRADAWVWGVTELVVSSNAEGWIEFYRREVEKQQNIVIPDDKPNNRPWGIKKDEPLDGGNLMKIYEQAYGGGFDAPNRKPVCARCKQIITDTTKVTDGVDSWHVGCAR